MLSRPKTSLDVWKRTAMATLCSISITLILVPLVFDLPNLRVDLMKCAGIAFVCSAPLAWLMGNEVRKNENLNSILRDLLNRDRLTDVATRDYFFERMDAAPESYGVSLMIDIDNFKGINDRYGHLVGDEVIRRVADILRNTVREDDIVCRFGGEEFIVFLSKYKSEAGVATAERIRKTIEAEVIRLQEMVITVTVSIGGSLKDSVTDINNAIKASDDALYRAKAAGRNQTIFQDTTLA